MKKSFGWSAAAAASPGWERAPAACGPLVESNSPGNPPAVLLGNSPGNPPGVLVLFNGMLYCVQWYADVVCGGGFQDLYGGGERRLASPENKP
ncbi:hypothetical protein [Leisingera sp.]|uniref:hypothetical protein n=1 Tax=Leisingera sp. TaxID=1879318 RepID=UPI002B264CBD|nr:hypothetical protein [Leisingera sp.]